MKKKNQHYVPKFYLRNFSDEGRNISLYNFNNDRFIPTASIKNQACSNFFYGEDEIIEKYFSIIEGAASKHIKEILENKVLPKYHSKPYFHLLMFMMTLGLRTPKAIDDMNEHLNKSLELFAQYDKRLSLFKDGEYRIELTDPVVSQIDLLEKNFHYVTDLRIKVIVNRTSLPFITSDSPIVKYNEYLEKRGYKYGFEGYGGMGLQIFLPISPTMMLMFYDGWTYKVSDKKVDFIETNSLNDVKCINLLQAIYSKNQLFFDKSSSEEQIRGIVMESKKYRELNKIDYENIGDYEHPDGKLSKRFSFGPAPIRINPNFTFTRITKNAKRYKFNDYAIQLRDERKRYLPDDY